MKWFLAVIAIAAVLAVPVAMLWGGETWGITGSEPLGSFQRMDEFLVGKGLRKSAYELDWNDCFSEELHERLSEFTVHRYAERESLQGEVKHRVLIILDRAGKVQAVGGSFFSRSRAYAESGTSVERFLARYWMAVGAGEPQFVLENEPDDPKWDDVLWSRVQRPKFEARWRKKPAGGDVRETRAIWDRILVWRR